MADRYNLKTIHVERQDPSRAKMSYSKELDTLYIHLDAFGGRHVACYLDDGVYALFDPETIEVVGFQVANWQRVFLNIHSDLKQFWPPLAEQKEPIGYIVEVISCYAPNECYA